MTEDKLQREIERAERIAKKLRALEDENERERKAMTEVLSAAPPSASPPTEGARHAPSKPLHPYALRG